LNGILEVFGKAVYVSFSLRSRQMLYCVFWTSIQVSVHPECPSHWSLTWKR